MEKNKKILGIISVILLLILVVTNVLLFKLYINELDNNKKEKIVYSYWFCLEGNYNTMELYYNKYNIEINKSDYDRLVEICYEMTFENLNYEGVNKKLKNSTIH